MNQGRRKSSSQYRWKRSDPDSPQCRAAGFGYSPKQAMTKILRRLLSHVPPSALDRDRAFPRSNLTSKSKTPRRCYMDKIEAQASSSCVRGVVRRSSTSIRCFASPQGVGHNSLYLRYGRLPVICQIEFYQDALTCIHSDHPAILRLRRPPKA